LLTVVGLGNPGMEYKKTRHNLGYMLVDLIADDNFGESVFRSNKKSWISRIPGVNDTFKKGRGPYLYKESEISGKSFCLVKPLTYMNQSGRAVEHIIKYGIAGDQEELLVVVDDVNLELGNLRFRLGGSAGGHNGLKSIIESLSSENFARLRIGIGKKPEYFEMTDYVLGRFSGEELKVIDNSLIKASKAVLCWITEGFEGISREINRAG